MKILMVNKFLYPNGGSETYIFKLGEELEAMGHEVQFFGMEDDRNVVGNRWNLYTGNMDFHTGKLQKLMYPVKIIYSKEAKRKMRDMLAKFQPDVVHLNNINFQITPSIIDEIRKNNIPIVWTAHDYQLVCPNHMMYQLSNKEMCAQCIDGKYKCCIRNRCIHGSKVKSLLGSMEAYFYKMRHTYRRVDTIICPSKFMEVQLQHNPDIKGKTVALHNFIDDIEWKECDKKGYILYFGRYSDEKGIRTLIEAARRLKDIPFVFAGKGLLEEEITGIPNIQNVGFQSGEALVTLIREANFSIYPSEWYENCPFSVMESQMYGTPVIGADIGGIPELIDENRTGLLYESKNLDQLVGTITSLWNDPEKQQQFHENCKTLQFDNLKLYCEKLLVIYKEKH